MRGVGGDGTYTVFQQRAVQNATSIVVVLVDDMDSFVMPLWDVLPFAKSAIGDRGTTFTEPVRAGSVVLSRARLC